MRLRITLSVADCTVSNHWKTSKAPAYAERLAAFCSSNNMDTDMYTRDQKHHMV